MADNVATKVDKQKILDIIPQKPPFRFIDEIIELSEENIIAQYRFKEDEYFYKGHFPGNPITPGVILVEAMAQAGVVALGIYLMNLEKERENILTFFTDCEVEFLKVVPPNSLVTIKAEKIFYRRNKLKTKVQLELENGEVAASGILSGIGVEE